MKFNNVFLFILIASSSAVAGELPGADFLNSAQDVRFAGSGSAFIALPEDAGALNYNPAGLGLMEGSSCNINYVDGLVDVSQFYCNYARKISYGTAGIGFLNHSAGSFTAFDGTGTEVANVKASDMVLSLAYGVPFKYNNLDCSAGIAFKGIMDTLTTYKNYGFAIDGGFLLKTVFLKLYSEGKNENFSFAVTVHNAGLPMKTAVQTYTLPTTLSAGIGYRIVEKKSSYLDLGLKGYLGSAEGINGVNTGIEFGWQDLMFMRLGYKIGTDAPFSAGLGIKKSNSAITYKFDFFYIYHPVDNMLGVSLTFDM